MEEGKVSHLSVLRMYKLYQQQPFCDNMKIILKAYRGGMSLFGALFSAYVCVVILLCNLGMSREAEAYIDMMNEIMPKSEKEIKEYGK